MKKLLLACAALIFCSSLFAQYTLSGRINDQAGTSVPYATVMLLAADQVEAAGGAADSLGRFVLSVPAGSYALQVRAAGYEQYSSNVTVASNMDAGVIVLQQEAIKLEEVTVKTQLITRQADRFVLNVAGSSQAIGRSADEMLKLAPGVWLTDDRLSINGQSGVRVMVNERLLNMDFESMMVYLRSIKAEDIQRIEVIPMSGADYDAASKGGIIKITLKKQRNDGVEGSLSMSYAQTSNNLINSLNPAATVNYRRGALSLYTNLSFSDNSDGQKIAEKTLYTASPDQMQTSTKLTNGGQNYYGRLGAIYDLDKRQSIGVEVNYNYVDNLTTMSGTSSYAGVDQGTNMFRTAPDSRNLGITANYIRHTDSLGSVIKVIADFYQNDGNSSGKFSNLQPVTMQPDSIYRNDLSNDYRIYSLSFSYDKVFSPTTVLKMGAKINYNDMWDNTIYDYMDIPTGTWYPMPLQSGQNKYTEQISALYGIFNTRMWKKLSVSAGLRAEYTYAEPEAAMGQGSSINEQIDLKEARQNYLSLFPNVYFSLPLNEKQSGHLILSYARKIERPPFWALNPFMMPLSRYSYVVGNPRLKPTMIDQFSLTAVAAYRYTLSVGVNLSHNGLRQVGYLDPADPEMFIYQHQNIDREQTWFAAANLPFTPYKWWDITANITALRIGSNYTGENSYSNAITTNVNTVFRMPHSFSFEASGWTQSGGIVVGNMQVGAEYGVDVALKKRFLNNKFTTSLNVWNIAKTNDQNIKLTGEGFTKYTTVTRRWTRYGISVRYNFAAGTSFKSKKVETGSREESSRMSK